MKTYPIFSTCCSIDEESYAPQISDQSENNNIYSSLRQIDRQTKSSDFTSDWRNRLGSKQHLFSHTFLVLVRSKHKSISLSFVAKPLQVEPQICNEHPGKINSINRQQPHTTADRPWKLFYNYLEMLMRK
jgi:hypothetical protein